MCNKQGNSVARDLPRTGSETNTTIFVIGYRFPLSLSTICGNHLPVNFMSKFPTCISTIWRNHLPFNQIKGPWASVGPLSFCFIEVMHNEF